MGRRSEGRRRRAIGTRWEGVCSFGGIGGYGESGIDGDGRKGVGRALIMASELSNLAR